ncbi:hypothetical protein [Tateyamaria pelophila]|uniref:hypothetical protein n=1 Tax=Tateyamaria pelophila TaxID=328415 RepID=UPI0029583FFA|nr:hypothetical protein [Tateyamaria pelophila]
MMELDARLLDAHARADTTALVTLYQEAAQGATNDAARGFYLTHAHVFALELGHPDAHDLRSKLVAMGRESPL